MESWSVEWSVWSLGSGVWSGVWSHVSSDQFQSVVRPACLQMLVLAEDSRRLQRCRGCGPAGWVPLTGPHSLIQTGKMQLGMAHTGGLAVCDSCAAVHAPHPGLRTLLLRTF